MYVLTDANFIFELSSQNLQVEVNFQQQKNVSLRFLFMQDEQVEVQKYVSVLQGYTGPLQVSMQS
jgi:hypothetical protein